MRHSFLAGICLVAVAVPQTAAGAQAATTLARRVPSGAAFTAPARLATVLTGAQTRAVGDAIVSQLSASVAGLTVGQVKAALTGAPCVTVSPNPPADVNGNGIPDDATYTFACSHKGYFGGSASLTGTATIVDTSTATSTAFTLTENGLIFSATGAAGGSFVEERSGTRSPAFSRTNIMLSQNLTTERYVAGGPAATLVNHSTLAFATAGGTIAPGSKLPSGSLAAFGSVAWASGSEKLTLTLSTPVSLAYDAACTAEPRIASGTIVVTVADTLPSLPANAAIRIVFHGCGVVPTITS